MSEQRVLILGAAGRDFQNFNVYFRDNPAYKVVAFTATQIPGIEGRTYPPEVSGARYPEGIPIRPEDELEDLIKKEKIDECVFSYSDVKHETVMHLASRCNAVGADFRMLSAKNGWIESKKPVVAVCAVRTGCGKSQTSRYVSKVLQNAGKKVVAVRHPMPYGDLSKQIVQRYASYEDMKKHDCTIEEREEYETHVEAGNIVYAGVDYGKILEQAEAEADVVIWDGGNNDTPFYKPDLWITVADPFRAGHELAYHPGETNLRGCDVVVINKATVAEPADVAKVEANIKAVNPNAVIIRGESKLIIEGAEQIKGKKVLTVDDGPTLTHGEMPFGAATIAARENGAAEMIDPRSVAVGSIKKVFDKFPHLGATLPAMGYSAEQVSELEQTINAADCDLVLFATPLDLGRLLKINKPALRVRYELADMDGPTLAEQIKAKFC